MVRKSGLGRGLDALIPSGESEGQATGVLEIPVNQIKVNPHQPRTLMEPQALQELAASIQEHGVLQPLVLRSDPEGGFWLITGERRWRAAQAAGLGTVPAVLREATPEQQLEWALIENLQRADLSPLEMAEAYRHLVEDFHLSQETVADRVGKSRVSVTNTLRLLKLPKTIQAALSEEKITEGHARALLGLKTTQAQLAALQSILKADLNVRQTEELVRRLNGERVVQAHKEREKEPEIRELEDRLRGQLGTRVDLRHGKKGGSLVIHYYSNEELDAIVAQILHA